MLTRIRGIKVAIEATKGTKVAGTIPVKTENLKIEPDFEMEERNGDGAYLGDTETDTPGALTGKATFDVEIIAEGEVATEILMTPGLAALLQACSLKQTQGGSPILEEYDIHSSESDQKTISIDGWFAGKKKGLAGAMGNVQFEGETGKRLIAKFEFHGRWQAQPGTTLAAIDPVDEAMPAFVYPTGIPMKLRDGTFTIGGATKKISKYNLNLGNNVVPVLDPNALGGIAYFRITNYKVRLGIDPEAELVSGHDFFGKWRSGATQAILLAIGDGSRNVNFSLPKVQYLELPEGDKDGTVVYELNGKCMQDINSSTGALDNEAVTISTSAAA